MARPRHHFALTLNALEALEDAEPDDSHLSGRVLDEDDEDVADVKTLQLRGCRAHWVPRGYYEVVIPAANVLVMEGNLWNFPHARAVADEMRRGSMAFGPPAARVHVITEDDVESTAGRDEEELLYDTGLVRPWQAKDVGQLYAQLIDGNHRAIAALSLGDNAIVAYVGENYRTEVPPTLWLDSWWGYA